jgi:hypothetical protein
LTGLNCPEDILHLKGTLTALTLLALSVAAPQTSQAGIAVSITIAPPVLPVYVQPPCPVDGYLWTPGYWAYGDAGYYWVPGVWVAPPRPGLFWTPGYWGFAGGVYGWHAGYWGPHVGFYGGVNYGFGFFGTGFVGGVWAGNVFRYNTAVVNVNTTVVHNVFVDRTVIHNTVVNRASFNGPGGIAARPTAQEQAFAREQHFQPTGSQLSHEQTFAHDRNALASVNHGRPATPSLASVNARPGGAQTAHAENRAANVNRAVPAERAAPAAQERQPVNRPQNNASKPRAAQHAEPREERHEK